MQKYSIAIAGTTKRTQQCAQTLLQSELFDISWILTPSAKPVGRKKIITSNAMENFAKDNNIPVVFIGKRISEEVKQNLEQLPIPDFLLVVDFGYIVPNWLLTLPRISPLNIHPSELPKWRGSSPGQFALLFNERESAVTLMVMDQKLDHGPIIHQDFFSVDMSWDQNDYYQHAFDLMCNNLDKKIVKFARDKNSTPQPDNSPTITAKMIKKSETFVPWEYIQKAINNYNPENIDKLPKLLQTAVKENKNLALTIERATKAFNPWPQVWTIVQTNQGEKRMKILETELQNGSLVLKEVQIEGKNPTKWNEVKNSILD